MCVSRFFIRKKAPRPGLLALEPRSCKWGPQLALSRTPALNPGLAGASWCSGAPLRGFLPREAARFHFWARVPFPAMASPRRSLHILPTTALPVHLDPLQAMQAIHMCFPNTQDSAGTQTNSANIHGMKKPLMVQTTTARSSQGCRVTRLNRACPQHPDPLQL